MEVEQALQLARDFLRTQSWWSDEKDVIVAVRRIEGSWVVAHRGRGHAESEDVLGGYGPVVVTDDGTVIPPEAPVVADHLDEFGIATIKSRTYSLPRDSVQ